LLSGMPVGESDCLETVTHTHPHASARSHLHTHASTRIRTHPHARTFTRTHTHPHASTRSHLHTMHTHMHAPTCSHLHTHAHASAHSYGRTCTHTHARTYARSLITHRTVTACFFPQGTQPTDPCFGDCLEDAIKGGKVTTDALVAEWEAAFTPALAGGCPRVQPSHDNSATRKV
jgi:hypothetical protein